MDKGTLYVNEQQGSGHGMTRCALTVAPSRSDVAMQDMRASEEEEGQNDNCDDGSPTRIIYTELINCLMWNA